MTVASLSEPFPSKEGAPQEVQRLLLGPKSGLECLICHVPLDSGSRVH